MKKMYFFLYCLMAFQVMLNAQSSPPSQTAKTTGSAKGLSDVYELWEVSKVPVFPGGDKELIKFMASNFVPEVNKGSIPCHVKLSFVIGIGGEVSDIQIVKNVFGDCGKAAVKMIAAMPVWQPGELEDGTPVKVRYTVPVRYQLD